MQELLPLLPGQVTTHNQAVSTATCLQQCFRTISSVYDDAIFAESKNKTTRTSDLGVKDAGSDCREPLLLTFNKICPRTGPEASDSTIHQYPVPRIDAYWSAQSYERLSNVCRGRAAVLAAKVARRNAERRERVNMEAARKLGDLAEKGRARAKEQYLQHVLSKQGR